LDKPILLSVGYAACHWCHVMAHESFENTATAALANQGFVCIKVDREERPDLDALYMAACQAMTGSGGWPLTVFLTPNLRPFFAGTYFPPDDRAGRPSFPRLLRAVGEAFRTRREEVEQQAAALHDVLRELAARPPTPQDVPRHRDALRVAADALLPHYDPVHGGTRGAPKFPLASDLLLLEAAARAGHRQAGEMSLLTCLRMVDGGIHDQLGGGFHRYATDERWLVPHFEKMLYDNALVPRALLAAYRRTGAAALRGAVEDTLGWALTEMRAPQGGFCASLDADSEGAEGTYYAWDPEQVRGALDPALSSLAMARWGVTDRGTFHQGTSVLHVAKPLHLLAAETGRTVEQVEAELRRARDALVRARNRRPRPARDDKVVAGWNGLMASALADAGTTLGRADWLEAAGSTLDFVWEQMRGKDGSLLRVHALGSSAISAPLEDHAYVAAALCDLHRATGDHLLLHRALELCRVMLDRFHDAESGGFHATLEGVPDLLVRARATRDDAIPCPGFVAARALLYAGTAAGDRGLVEAADGVARLHGADLLSRPHAVASLAGAWEGLARGPASVVVVGPVGSDLAHVARRCTEPTVMVLEGETVAGPLGEGKAARNGMAVAHVCADGSCRAPVVTVDALRRVLEEAGLVTAAGLALGG
jgi:hypothetical protein